MSKITGYKIASADRQDIFESNVANLITEGYQPYGEIKILQPNANNYHGFWQVMVKIVPTPTKVKPEDK